MDTYGRALQWLPTSFRVKELSFTGLHGTHTCPPSPCDFDLLLCLEIPTSLLPAPTHQTYSSLDPCSAASSVWKDLTPFPTPRLCSEVTFSVKPSMTILFKTLTPPSNTWISLTLFCFYLSMRHLFPSNILFDLLIYWVPYLLFSLGHTLQGAKISVVFFFSLVCANQPEKLVIQGIH